jgi:putative tricarboxylic transport membrane protein
MTRRSSRIVARAAAAAVAVAGWQLAVVQSGQAGEWVPEAPIEVLVPWGPGGGASTISEVVARLAAERGLSEAPMVLTHRPGASGLVGTALVADRKGDALVFMPGGGALLAQVVVGESPVHPLEDLTPLALSAVDSSVVIARADSPFETLTDVIDHLMQHPRSLTMCGAGGGPASWDGMLETVLAAVAGVEFNQIPFASGAEVQAAVLGGQVDIGTRQLSNAEALISAGELKALAIFDAERNPKLPDVPTLRELGIDVVLNMSRGWFAPAGLSQDQIDWYADFFRDLSETPEWIAYLDQNGLQNRYLPPAEWAVFVTDGMATIERIYREIGIIQ